MTLHSLPLFVRLAGRPVMLLGDGDAADAKRRLLERAGAEIVDETADARLAIVAIEDADAAKSAVMRLRSRGILINAVDRPELCDFTLPAIVDRAPVLVAIGTGGVSAGLAAALRQRLEAVLPAGLGRLAEGLQAMRGALRERYPDPAVRRRAIAAALAEGGPLDPLSPAYRVNFLHLSPDLHLSPEAAEPQLVTVRITSVDPDDLTLRQARALANADRVIHDPDVPAAILDRARADAERVPAPAEPGPGLTVVVTLA